MPSVTRYFISSKQGLTLVHYLTGREHFLIDTLGGLGCA